MGNRKAQGHHSPDLTPEEKLALIDQQLNSLCDFCEVAGCSPEEIYATTRSLFTEVWYAKAKLWARRAALMICVIAVVYGFIKMEMVSRFFLLAGRLLMIQLLPLWDWTGVYYKECVIENPYYDLGGRNRTDEFCQVCESFEEFERLSNVEHATVTEDFLNLDKPLIVTDAIDSWPVRKWNTMDTEGILQLFDGEHNEICFFSTNLGIKAKYLDGFLAKVRRPSSGKWFVHWQNCEKPSAKVLRGLYHRPYFIPPMVDMSDANWVFMSSNYTGRVYKEIPFSSDLIWFAQIKGSSRVRLIPREPCHKFCPEMETELLEGEIIMFTDFLWAAGYLPLPGGENIAIAAGGLW